MAFTVVAWVQALVGELRSCKLLQCTKKKKKKKFVFELKKYITWLKAKRYENIFAVTAVPCPILLHPS